MSMLGVDLDPETTELERATWETAHRFARDVMRPAGEKLDKLPAADVIARDSILWDVFKKHRELGLGAVSETPGLTVQEQVRLGGIISEEMGWGDSGLNISLGVANSTLRMARLSGNQSLIERFPPGIIGCWAITEPGHGSDEINFNGALNHPGVTVDHSDCIARLDGNQFVISGQKSGWVSNGTIAQAASLYCAVDMGDGRKGHGVFLVRLDEGGVTKGKPTDKIGQRALNQGEIFFNDLKVPADSMVVPPERYQTHIYNTLCGANAGMGTSFVGVARAALELAIDYAKTRVQGGAPLIEHQSMKSRLFRMYQKVEAARALNQRARRINAARSAAGLEPLLELSITSKVTSTEAAFQVASDALQVFGGAGISRDCPIEKIFRDARISMIEDGCNEVLGMLAAARF